MATHKTITRNEVNAIKSGVFSTDLKKSVLYSEVSGNSSFNVSATNNASGLNYKANQILLESDIMAAAPIPPDTCKFKFVYKPEVVVTNVTGGQIIFDGTSQAGTESFKLTLPNAVIGTGFDGKIDPNEYSGYVSITSELEPEYEYSRTDVIQIPIEYNFVGTKDGMYNQKVELSVTFSCEAGFDNLILNDGGSATLDASSWFSSGNVVTVNVTFEINVGNQTPN